MIAFQHWNCESCKAYNDVLHNHCRLCKTYKPSWVTALHQMRVEFARGIFDDYGVLSAFCYRREGRVNLNQMTTPNEELHAKFFNEETLLVQGMADADLEEHIQELETIAREAKARILAATEVKRTRTAKSGNKNWKVEPLGPDPTVTDSLNKVKQRSARMGKLEKMRNSMSSIGIPDSEIEQMLAKMIAQARKDPAALREEVRLKGDLNKPIEPSIVTEAEQEQRIANRKALELEDIAIAKAEKEKLAAVHENKDEKLILTIDEKAPVPAKPSEPITGKLDLSKLKFT